MLSGGDALIHARLRTDGTDDRRSALARHSRLASLLGLRLALFAGAVLDGTWEAVVYVPDAGQSVPPVALALGFTLRELAVAAAERLLDELAMAWPVHRTPFRIDDAPGACLLDLNVLPDLAPCYVATKSALVFGWNPASLRKALRRAAPAAAMGESSSVRVELARFPEADRVLSQTAHPALESVPRDFPWRALRAEGRRENQQYLFRVTLAAGSAP